MMHWQGLTDLTYRDFTPLAQMNYDPPAIQVRTDAPYDNVKELLAAIKKKPEGTFKASGTGQGGIWQVALYGLLLNQGIDDPQKVVWVPSQGAAPGLRDLVAGGVQIVPCSIPEAQTMISAGKVKSLAVLSDKRNPAFPDVPTLKEEIGSDYSLGAWRGIVAPKGLPKAVAHKLEAALKKVYNSDEFKQFMNKRGLGMKWRDAKDFKAYLAKNNEMFGKIMKKVGLAK
jgi:tripartite-type tricarboxylate transporter receptor subunit TctC